MYNSSEKYVEVSYTIKDVVRRAAEDGITLSNEEAKLILVKDGQSIMEDAYNAGLDSISGLVKIWTYGKGRQIDTHA